MSIAGTLGEVRKMVDLTADAPSPFGDLLERHRRGHHDADPCALFFELLTFVNYGCTPQRKKGSYRRTPQTARAPASPISATPAVDTPPTTSASTATTTASARLGSSDRDSTPCWISWTTATTNNAMAM